MHADGYLIHSMAEYVNCIEELSPRSVLKWDETHINQVVADGGIQFDLFDGLCKPQLLDLLKYVNGELPRDSGLAPFQMFRCWITFWDEKLGGKKKVGGECI